MQRTALAAPATSKGLVKNPQRCGASTYLSTGVGEDGRSREDLQRYLSRPESLTLAHLSAQNNSAGSFRERRGRCDGDVGARAIRKDGDLKTLANVSSTVAPVSVRAYIAAMTLTEDDHGE